MHHGMKRGMTALLLVPVAMCAFARDIALSPDGMLLLTANHDARSLSRIDTGSLAHSGDISLGMEPQGVAFDSSGRAWVTFRHHDRVGVYEPASGANLAMIEVGDEPFDALEISSDQMAITLFRASQIEILDKNSLESVQQVAFDAHPRGVALSANGTKLYVTHFFSGRLSIVDIESLTVEDVIQPEADGNLFQNLAVAGDGNRLYLPITRSNASNPNLTFDTTVFPVVSVIDPVAAVPVPNERISLDIADEPVGIPIDAALTADHLFVLNAASNDVSVINRVTSLADDHIEVGDNPRSMVLSHDGLKLFVHNSLSSSVSVVDTVSLSVTNVVAVAPSPLSANLLNGKRLFNSSDRADMSRDQWIACATCHFDGEMDTRTWFFPDGLRNTTSLLGSGATAPYHWSGDLDELQDVEATIRDIQAGTGLAEGPDNCTPTCDTGPPNAGRSQDLDDLAAFMASLEFSPNPFTGPSDQLSESAQRGYNLFYSPVTGCSGCHTPPLFTDHLRHDIGTGGGPDENKGPEFDTPSLRGVYATAPYLHDGRAITLLSVLTTHNIGDLHGSTSGLTDNEIDDIVDFLKSLTDDPPLFRRGFE